MTFARSDDTEFQSTRGTWWAATVAVAAAAVYGLWFVRAALPELAAGVSGTAEWRLRQLLTWITLGGMLGGVLGGWRFRLVAYQRLLGWAFRAAAAVAALALMAQAWSVMVTTALMAGVAMGWLLVVLAAGLRASAGTRGLGQALGVAWAVAWASVALAEAFELSPRTLAIVGALVAASGSLATPFLTPQEPSVSLRPEYRPAGIARWTLVFAGLVALAVAVPLPAEGADVAMPVVVALGAAAASLPAGWLLDRRPVVVSAYGVLMLFVGSVLTGWIGPPAAGSALAAAGEALLVVALLDFVVRGGRVSAAVWLFSVAGWGAALVAGTVRAGAPERGLVLALVAAGLAVAGLVWRPRA